MAKGAVGGQGRVLQALMMGAWLLPLPHCGPRHCLLGMSHSSGRTRLQGTVSKGKACLGEWGDAALHPSSSRPSQALPRACRGGGAVVEGDPEHLCSL